MTERAERFVRSIRDEPRPERMCTRCGVLLARDEECDGHPGQTGPLDGAWLAKRGKAERRPLPRSYALACVFLFALGAYALVVSRGFVYPEALLVGGSLLLCISVPMSAYAVFRRKQRVLPTRSSYRHPAIGPSVIGTVQALDNDDRWVGYQITSEPWNLLTPMDGWVEELLIELDDGRRVIVPTGRARIFRGTDYEVSRSAMDAIRRRWLEGTDLEPENTRFGDGGGLAKVLQAGDRVRLHMEIEERVESENAYRSAGRHVARGLVLIAHAD